jgi:glycosyltransferase involved in cell wall biosynthesis
MKTMQKSGFFPDGSKLKILCVPANEGGCAYYRVLSPYAKLQELYPDKVEVRFNKNPLGAKGDGQWEEDWEFEDMKWADVIVINNISNYGGPYTARVLGKGKEFGKKVQFDTDDLLTDLYDGHRLQKVYEEHNLYEITKFIYNQSDIVSVTQKKFAERISDVCGGVLCVIKNAIDYNLECWNFPKIQTPRKNFTRFGWAGGIHHEEDVKEFGGVPHFVNQRVGDKNCRWDFIGHPPPPGPGEKEDWQHDVWKSYRKILLRGFKKSTNWGIHYALPCDKYGAFFANMDVALAPLQMNNFNDSKSEIKVAECGRYAIPLVASNVGCYDETIIQGETGWLMEPGAPPGDWVKILTKIAKDKKWRDEMGKNLKAIADEYFDLNKVVHYRLDLYKTVFNIDD